MKANILQIRKSADFCENRLRKILIFSCLNAIIKLQKMIVYPHGADRPSSPPFYPFNVPLKGVFLCILSHFYVKMDWAVCKWVCGCFFCEIVCGMLFFV